MVERVARVICGATADRMCCGKCTKCTALLAEARAVIAALREPTGAMKDAGAASYGIHTPAIGSLPLEVIDGQPTKAWTAMIDEALK